MPFNYDNLAVCGRLGGREEGGEGCNSDITSPSDNRISMGTHYKVEESSRRK